MTVNIQAYGAVGDGITDCFAAFQNAEDYLRDTFGSGEIFVPAGRYLVSKPFYHWSFITLTGEGQASVIVNVTTPTFGETNFCIHIGNMKPSSFIACVHYRVKDIEAGQAFVKLKDGDVSRFSAGDAVLIDSTSGFYNVKGDFKPYYAYVNRVAAVDSTRQTLCLEDPIPEYVEGANVALAKNDNPNEYICQFPTVQNISFESLGNWTLRFGCYKGVFKNIFIQSTDVIGGNGISHCTFENIVAQFTQKVIELATYSHESIVTDLTATWYDGYADPDFKPLLKMGENVRNCVFKNLHIDAGLMTNIGMLIRFEHAFSNKIFDSDITAQNPTGGVVEFTTSEADSIVTKNLVTGNDFYVTTARAFVICDVDGTTATMKGNSIISNRFHGTVNQDEMGDVLDQNIVSNQYN